MGKRDDFLIKADEMFCGINNFLISIKDIFYRNSKLLKRNEELNVDDNKEKLCFIIGNGPSLKTVNLESVQQYPCLTVNFFHKGCEKFQSKYHLLIDPEFATIHFDWVKQILNKYPSTNLLVDDKIYKRFVVENISTEMIYLIHHSYVQSCGNIKVDMTKNMTGSSNVVPVAIECAISMGYQNIILLGCDFSMYTESKGKHFYNAEISQENLNLKNNISTNNVGNLIRCALIHKQHYAINKKAIEMGVHIYNATPNSLIDAYDFISFEDVLKKFKK